jgi:phenylalanine-4-hydroxylase
MEIRPLDIAAMTTVEYDITSYQPVLFGAASFGELEEVVGGFFASVDDDTPQRLGLAAVA